MTLQLFPTSCKTLARSLSGSRFVCVSCSPIVWAVAGIARPLARCGCRGGAVGRSGERIRRWRWGWSTGRSWPRGRLLLQLANQALKIGKEGDPCKARIWIQDKYPLIDSLNHSSQTTHFPGCRGKSQTSIDHPNRVCGGEKTENLFLLTRLLATRHGDLPLKMK